MLHLFSHKSASEDAGREFFPALKKLFSDCADFSSRELAPGADTHGRFTLCWLDGLISGSELAETVLRPLAESEELAACRTDEECRAAILRGAVWCASASPCADTEAAAFALTHGQCVLCIGSLALGFEARSSHFRDVSEPSVEKSVLGARDAFTEVYRVNTALIRRRLATPKLKLRELTLGRESLTQAGVLYCEGAARSETAEELLRRLQSARIDSISSIGDIEVAIADRPRSVFPRFLYTERPDRLCRALLDGRVALLADGFPFALIAPCTLPELLRTEEDRALHSIAAGVIVALRWLGLLLALTLPALYAAVSLYHQELIPYKLLQSIIAAKQRVPFSTGAEITGMLICFSLLQEAGVRLPESSGAAVSIIGTLIVGQSAVEARVVSPVTVIVVALSAVAGYTQPNQHLGNAVRLWRFLLLLLSIAFGAFGLTAGLVVLLQKLCDTESFGVCYLYPLVDGDHRPLRRSFLRPPRAPAGQITRKGRAPK